MRVSFRIAWRCVDSLRGENGAMECVVTGHCLVPASLSFRRDIHLNFMRIPCKAIEIDEEWFEGALPNHYGTKYRATAHRLSPLVVVRK